MHWIIHIRHWHWDCHRVTPSVEKQNISHISVLKEPSVWEWGIFQFMEETLTCIIATSCYTGGKARNSLQLVKLVYTVSRSGSYIVE